MIVGDLASERASARFIAKRKSASYRTKSSCNARAHAYIHAYAARAQFNSISPLGSGDGGGGQSIAARSRASHIARLRVLCDRPEVVCVAHARANLLFLRASHCAIVVVVVTNCAIKARP